MAATYLKFAFGSLDGGKIMTNVTNETPFVEQ